MSFNEKDRVKRKDSTDICGTIIQIRKELETSMSNKEDIPEIIKVKWDNGTTSFFDPGALEAVTE